MSFIKAENISFTYNNGFVAVENVSFTIEKGSSIAIIGQNGAGKTTTVKMINGLFKPTQGDIWIGDMNTKDYTTAQISRKVGYVFQNPDDQIFHGDVLGEIEFGPKVLNFSEKEKRIAVDRAIELTQLYDVRYENPYNLPLSTRKFVSIAAVLAMDTEVIILDEPTAGQDLWGINTLKNLLIHCKNRNQTVITITHDMEFVVQNFENIMVMANKSLLDYNNVRDVFWNLDLLEQSNLKQTCICSLAHKLDLGQHKILHSEELIQILKNNKQ